MEDGFLNVPGDNMVALLPTDPEWQPIFHASNQVVLYNPTSHALSISHSSNFPETARHPCPYCKQPLPAEFEPEPEEDNIESLGSDPAYHSRASDYFQLLAIANETTASRTLSPPPIADSNQGRRNSTFPAEAMAEGYFKAFFQEEYKLGMGANGSVFLCQHMLDGNPLGHFAVKKIAVGESHSYLLKILREVRLLEQLRHPNIVTYHHAWLESCQFSSFGPKVPTLHVLMQWAEGGSLDDFIDARLGRATHHIHIDTQVPLAPESPKTPTTPISVIPIKQGTQPPDGSGSGQHSRSARIRAFRAFQHALPEERERLRREMEGVKESEQGQRTSWTAVHLLSAEEAKSLFKDVVEGLAFLHDKSILHLDLKPGNVLLTWDEGRMIPRAMLSDFGTSRDMIHTSLARSGNTGTLEYTSPESLPSPHTGLLQQIDSKADMWSLGMILHKLLLFRLPYRYASVGDANGEPISVTQEGDKLDRLEKEVLSYSGFKSTNALVTAFEARRLPRAFLLLLESLLNVVPSSRPSCERVLGAIREGRLDPLKEYGRRSNSGSSLVPVARRGSMPDPSIDAPPNNGFNRIVTDEPTRLGSDTADPTPRGRDPSVVREKTRFLGLPAPTDNIDSWTRSVEEDSSSSTVVAAAAAAATATTLTRRIPSISWVRTLKSCILVAKVLMLPSICSEGSCHPVLSAVVIAAAIADTCFEELWISLVFASFHVAVIGFGCSNQRCCV